MAIITASPGPDGGIKAQASLIQTLTAMSADILQGAVASVPAVYKKMNEEGNIIDPETLDILERCLKILMFAVRARPDDILKIDSAGG